MHDYQIISLPSGRVWNFDTKEARDLFVEENNLSSARINLNPIEVTAKAVTPAAKVTATQSAFRANPTPENAYRYHDALAMANPANPYNATKLLLGYNAAIPVVAGLGMGLATAGEAVAPLIAPYKPAIDATFGAIGALNLVSDNGVRKTINLFSNRDYSNGVVSLLGDALDLTMASNGLRSALPSIQNIRWTSNVPIMSKNFSSNTLQINGPEILKTLVEIAKEPSFILNYSTKKLPWKQAIQEALFDNLGKYSIRTPHPEVYDFHTRYLVPRFKAFGVLNPNISDIKIYDTKTPGVMRPTGVLGLFDHSRRAALMDPTATPTTSIHEVSSHGTDMYVPVPIQNIYSNIALDLTMYGAKHPYSELWNELRATKNELMSIDPNMGNFLSITPELIEKFRKGLSLINSSYSLDYLDNLSANPGLHDAFRLIWPLPVVSGAAALPNEEENY